MLARLKEQRGGFSLIELLVTIFIAGVFFSAMVPLFISAQKKNSSDSARILCLTVARDRIEKVRQLEFKDIAANPANVAPNQATANLYDPTFKSGQFGRVYSNMIDGTATRAVYVDYNVYTDPTGKYKIVTVTTNWDDPTTAAHEPPQPAYATVLKTEIYKQFSGPQIIKFQVLENGAPVDQEFTAAQVTLQAIINPGDVGSMRLDLPVLPLPAPQRGRMAFAVLNSAGNVIQRQDVVVPVGGQNNQYEWVWDTAAVPDGQYSFVAVAYGADSSEGNSWQLTYLLDKGPPVAPTVTAVAGNASVSLSWVCVPEPTDLDRYEVWRSSTGSAGTYVQVVPSTTSKTYLDMGLTNGTTYWYRVAAVDYKLQSSFSTAVSALPVAPVGDTTGPTAPSGLSAAKGGANVAAIKLTWTTPSVDNPPPATPSGMVGGHYVVQRASDAAFTTGVSTLSTTHPYGNLTYTDATAGYSATWHYRIAGVDLAGNQGPWSVVVDAPTTDAPVPRSLTVTRSTNKYYVWVQSQLPPFLYYTTAGDSSVAMPAGTFGQKNSANTWIKLPSGLYKVIYSTYAGGTPQTGTKDADCSSANASVSI